MKVNGEDSTSLTKLPVYQSCGNRWEWSSPAKIMARFGVNLLCYTIAQGKFDRNPKICSELSHEDIHE